MTNKIRKLFRQGDVLFRQINSKEKSELFHPDEIKKMSYKRFIVRTGESGNKHTLVAEQPFTILKGKYGGEDMAVEIKNGVGILKHEEHKELTIPKGIYSVINEREWDYLNQWSQEIRD